MPCALAYAIAHIVIPYVLAVIMPNWRWLLGWIVIGGGIVTWQWSRHWIAEQSPDYALSAGGIIGLGLMTLSTLSFVWGVVIRSLSLVLTYIGWSRRQITAVNILGLFFMLAGLGIWLYRALTLS